MTDPRLEVRFLVRAHRILDATNATEYNALSAGNKEAYKMILSCSLVNLANNSPTRTKLWNMFGEGTTTRDNLEVLLPADAIEE